VKRLPSIDRVRGLAVVLMVVDHVLVLVQFRSPEVVQWAYALRMTVTRASLPLFCLCAGVLLHGRRSTARLLDIAAVALVTNVALEVWPMGIRAPEILAVLLPVLLAGGVLVRWPAASVVLGVLQVTVWPIGWAGYEPGLVVAFVALGVLVGRPALSWGDSLPAALGAVGSRPLAWYAGHMGLLVALNQVL